jgi:hypothetical protein
MLGKMEEYCKIIMKTLRETFNRGYGHRWSEKLENNLKEYFVNRTGTG